jgi:hypothetical protein
VVPEDDSFPAIGCAVYLAHHAGAKIADAEASAFVSEDNPVVVVVDAVLYHGRGDEAGPQSSFLEPAYLLLQKSGKSGKSG